MSWKPIETAPRDGTALVAADPRFWPCVMSSVCIRYVPDEEEGSDWCWEDLSGNGDWYSDAEMAGWLWTAAPLPSPPSGED
jgi:hypothetical protein